MFLDVLDEESLPTNSDVVIVFSQYLSAMRKYEEGYFLPDPCKFRKRWSTQENPIV